MRRLDDDVIDALVEGAGRFTSDVDCIMLHDFHGAPTRVAVDAAAFPLRDNQFNVQVLA